MRAEAGLDSPLPSMPAVKNATGGVDVVNNPNLRVPDCPEWFAWAAKIEAGLDAAMATAKPLWDEPTVQPYAEAG